MHKKIFIIGVGLVVMIFISNFIHQISDSLQINRRLDAQTEELFRLQKRNTELKKRLTEVRSLSFIEQQARDKLNLAREGDTIMVISKGEIQKVLGVGKKVEEIKLPNWQGWLRLFNK